LRTGLARVRIRAADDAGGCVGLYVDFAFFSLLSVTSPDFRSGADSILPSLRGHAKDKRRWCRRFRKPGDLSQQHHPNRESKPCCCCYWYWYPRRRRRRRQRHQIRTRTTTSFSQRSQTSMRNSQRYMLRSLRGQLFSCFPGTAIRAICLPSPLGARSTRRRRVRIR
jgi:hypothetical protein